MMDLVNFVEMILAVSGSISQMHEKAKRSTPPRSEQRFEESRRGSMSIRRSVKYTVVHLERGNGVISIYLHLNPFTFEKIDH